MLKSMAERNVKLLGSWSSPFVLRARIALNINSVEYEFLEEKLAYKSELLLKSNPVYKKIPVLIHDDKPVCESLIIVEYVDEFWSSGPSILPSDPYDRAIARFWASYIDEKLVPIMKDSTLADSADVKKAAMEEAIEGLVLMEDPYVKCSKGKPFFGGNQIGLVDIALGSSLAWMKAGEKMHNNLKMLDEVKTPGLLKWAESFCAHAAVKDVLLHPDKIAEFLQDVAKSKASAQLWGMN